MNKGGHFAAWEDPELLPKNFALRSSRCASVNMSRRAHHAASA
ncbi:hypothetical protein [Lysobacter gummosus]